jgi:hypothetical protein
MRAIQILGQLGGPDSQRLLNRLAQGAPGASETPLAQQPWDASLRPRAEETEMLLVFSRNACDADAPLSAGVSWPF